MDHEKVLRLARAGALLIGIVATVTSALIQVGGYKQTIDTLDRRVEALEAVQKDREAARKSEADAILALNRTLEKLWQSERD